MAYRYSTFTLQIPIEVNNRLLMLMIMTVYEIEYAASHA